MIPLNDPDIRRRTTPWIVYSLLAINVLVAAFQMLVLTEIEQAVFIYRFGIVPWELSGYGELGSQPLVQGGPLVELTVLPAWATMFTSMFLHGGLLHLGGNMLFLWVFGNSIEDRFGHAKFLIFYLLTGVAAVWAQVYVNPESQVPMVGASGAIAGVLGAYIVMFPHSRVHTLLIVGIIFHARLPAILLLGAWVGIQAIQAILGIGTAGVAQTGGVAYFAHLGGFVAGAPFGLLYRIFGRPPGPPRGSRQYWRGRPLD